MRVPPDHQSSCDTDADAQRVAAAAALQARCLRFPIDQPGWRELIEGAIFLSNRAPAGR